jgi:hypothetical protein
MKNEFKPNSNQMKHPEKWYIPVTEENHAELNQWRLSKRTQEASKWDDSFVPGATLLSAHPYHDGSYFYAKSCRIDETERNNGYQEITLEQFREITNPKPMKHPEKWYIPVTEENHAELQTWWLKKVLKSGWTSDPDARLREDVLLSEHPTDSSYYWCGSEKSFTESYRSYKKITLEQFREITNPHPEHWCIEATEENFKELYAWWRNNAPERYTCFQVGYTLVSGHPRDESKYYGGSIANCLDDYPQFVEITLEQFRQTTNTNQTTMSKSIQISRDLLNAYYDAATPPQREYLTEHFKLDGTTTEEAIRGLHDMACEGWKPKIKKNHPDCFPKDSKYFDFSKHADKSVQEKRVVSADVCESLGLTEGNGGFIQVRNNSDNPETHHRSFYLNSRYNWELVQDGPAMVLIPTKKSC